MARSFLLSIAVSEEEGSLYLKSFHAVGWGRGEKEEIGSFDYIVPDETVMLNVPLVIPGLRPMEPKH